MIYRKIQPPLNIIDNFDFLEPQHYWLDNGIPVYLFNYGIQDIIKIDFIFDAGSWHQQQPLTARFTSRMLSEGTENYTAFEIANQLDSLGVALSNIAMKDSSLISVSLLSKHFDKILPLINEIINKPVFPNKELEIQKYYGKQMFIDDSLKVNELATRYFGNQLFGDAHPYGIMIKANDFDGVNAQQLKYFHKQHFIPGNCKIVISGKFSTFALSQLNDVFGKLISQNVVGPEKNGFQVKAKETKMKVEMPDAVQSALHVGKITIGKKHDDYLALSIVNTLLGGYFGSRLMKNIREDKGFTYGIYSSLVTFRHAAIFYISSEVNAGMSRQALNEIYSELKKLRTEKVSGSELDLVKKYLSGNILRSFDGPFSTAVRFKGLLELDIDYKDYYQKLIKTIHKINAYDVIEIMQKYLHEDSMLELIVGK
jgi:predicted Zn-dependent peptidase